MLLFGAAIIGRLFFVQVLNGKLYQAQALGQQIIFSSAQGSRGQIFIESSQKNKGASGSGEIKSLAINKDEWTIFADLSGIEDKLYFAQSLAPLTGLSKEDILSELESEGTRKIIKKGLSDEQLEEIKKINLDGLSWENEAARYYPQERLASQVVGFFGGNKTGQYGIEGYYEDVLKGKTGIKEDKKGLDSILSNDGAVSLDGSDLYLTLDYNIQFEAETLLKEAANNLGIESGQVVVLKPDSGRILAIANFPSFDPNNYSAENNLEIFQNSAAQKLFEPGSIMKPFTMAAALNEGKINPDTTYTDAGFVKVGRETIRNFANEVYGQQTMTGVLEKSINTGAVFVSQQISHKTFLDYLSKFGFFEKTGVDLQGETYSSNENLKTGPDVEYATASFGQGIELTPIQIARGFCAIANGGKLPKPYVVEKIVGGQDGTSINRETFRQIISQETASKLTKMLISVVERGFGSGAKIPGYYLAGKTGTAEVPLKDGRGYEEDKTIQSFIGFGPALNPQFLILVKLDDPKVSKSSLSAVPIFKKLAQYIINYWQIPPDYDNEQ